MDIWEKLQEVEQNYYAIEQQLQSIARTLPAPIYIIDEFGKYIDVLGSKELSPYHSSKIHIGKYLHDVLSEDIADNLMATISEAIAENMLKITEYQLGPQDLLSFKAEGAGEIQWLESRFYPIKNKNQEVHSVIWLSLNITERKKLEEQLQELSEKDDLTGAYNRRHFMQIFEKEFSITKRYKSPLSILLIDIDSFKDINQTYGLEIGDAVMTTFAQFCEDLLRQSDLFACYGGGKFIVMLPSTPSLGAAIIGERIRANAEELLINHEKQIIQFTVSIGISLVLDSDSNSNGILARVHTALYNAKKKGRNRIEIA